MNCLSWRSICGCIILMLALLSCQSGSQQELLVYQCAGQIWGLDPESMQAHVLEGEWVRAWSPNGERMKYTMNKWVGPESLWVANADGSNPYQVSGEFDCIGGVWLGDDLIVGDVITGDRSTGDAFYLWAESRDFIIDLRAGTMRWYAPTPQPRDFPLPPAAAELIPFPSGDGWIETYSKVYLFDLEGNVQHIFQDYDVDRGGLAVSPSGREIVFLDVAFLASSQVEAGLYYAQREGNHVTAPVLVYLTPYLGKLRWSPDGQYVALLDNQNIFHILDARTFELLNQIRIRSVVTNFIWSPHSDALAAYQRYSAGANPEADPERIEGFVAGEFVQDEIARVAIQTGEITRLTYDKCEKDILDWVVITSK